MMDSLYIAWRYLAFSKLRSAILVASITLIAVLPMALQLILEEAEQQLVARAILTPLLIGAKGSALDLVMNSLYFSDEFPETIPMAAADTVMETGLADAIPLYVRFRARGFPIVGTTLDYLDFRRLRVAEGRPFSLLGECVLGHAVAEELGLQPGDSLVSSPDNLFDLAGVYPLKMKVAGVLARSHSADDQAILVDINTAWIIQGLAHGHEDLAKTTAPSVILKRDSNKVTANAKLLQYREITAANLDSFHFHGDSSEYPLSGVIALPRDDKSGTILQGRYLANDALHQIVRPGEVIDTLMASIFRIKNVLDAVILIVGIATVLALMLVFALSLRLRQGEIETIFKLGCSRATIARLLGAEVFIIMGISGLICGGLLLLVNHYSQVLVRSLLM